VKTGSKTICTNHYRRCYEDEDVTFKQGEWVGLLLEALDKLAKNSTQPFPFKGRKKKTDTTPRQKPSAGHGGWNGETWTSHVFCAIVSEVSTKHLTARGHILFLLRAKADFQAAAMG